MKPRGSGAFGGAEAELAREMEKRLTHRPWVDRATAVEGEQRRPGVDRAGTLCPSAQMAAQQGSDLGTEGDQTALAELASTNGEEVLR